VYTTVESTEREALLNRRHYNCEQTQLWDKLSLAQKFAVCSLTQFGYELVFIRNSHIESLAVLLCSKKSATIDQNGEINTSPNIYIRS
jgi:hypothetical protein